MVYTISMVRFPVKTFGVSFRIRAIQGYIRVPMTAQDEDDVEGEEDEDYHAGHGDASDISGGNLNNKENRQPGRATRLQARKRYIYSTEA